MAFPDWQSTGVTGLIRVGFALDGSDGNIPINSASLYAAIIFVPVVSESMTGFDVRMAGSTGTVTNGTTATLHPLTSAGLPDLGTTLATVTTTTNNNQVYTLSWSAAYTVTAGTPYAVVIKNVLGSPASNYFQLNIRRSDRIPSEFYLMFSSDSGTTWQSSNTGYSTSRFSPVYATSGRIARHTFDLGGSGDGSNKIYTATGTYKGIQAIKVNFPVDVLLHRLVWSSGKVGSPTFDLRGVVFNSSGTELSVSDSRWNVVNTSNLAMVQWVTPYTLTASTDYYLGITPDGTNVGDASNYARTGRSSRSLGGTPVFYGMFLGAYFSSAISASWSASDESSVGGMIEAHIEIPYAAGGSSSILCQRGMNGGFPR